MNKFVLKIRLGNEAMQDPRDVAFALRCLAVRLSGHDGNTDRGDIRDINGNIVGEWRID